MIKLRISLSPLHYRCLTRSRSSLITLANRPLVLPSSSPSLTLSHNNHDHHHNHTHGDHITPLSWRTATTTTIRYYHHESPPQPPPNNRNAQQQKRFYMLLGSCIAIVLTLLYGYFSEEVPVIGRRRLLLVPLNMEKSMGEEQFQTIRSNSRILPKHHPYSQMIEKVGKRLGEVSNTDLNFHWEFIVIDEDVDNAFCLPGGKVVFYRGLLDRLFDEKNKQKQKQKQKQGLILVNVSNNDDDYDGWFGDSFGTNTTNTTTTTAVPLTPLEKESMVAAVMAHEISHALLRHHSEQMTTHAASGLLLALFRLVLGDSLPGDTLLMNVGVLLPFSRKHEYEADLIGLYLMSRACYNPEYAIRAFNRMKEAMAPNESNVASYISTHPSFTHRVEIFQKHLKSAQRERSKFCYTKSEVMERGVSGKRKHVKYWWEDLRIDN